MKIALRFDTSNSITRAQFTPRFPIEALVEKSRRLAQLEEKECLPAAGHVLGKSVGCAHRQRIPTTLVFSFRLVDFGAWRILKRRRRVRFKSLEDAPSMGQRS